MRAPLLLRPIGLSLVLAASALAGVGPLLGDGAALAVTVGPNVNLSAAPGNQVESAIAVDPHNANRILTVPVPVI